MCDTAVCLFVVRRQDSEEKYLFKISTLSLSGEKTIYRVIRSPVTEVCYIVGYLLVEITRKTCFLTIQYNLSLFTTADQ